MTDAHPILTGGGDIVFASSSALKRAMPRLRFGTLIAMGGPVTLGSMMPARLVGQGRQASFDVTAKPITAVGERVLLRLDVPESVFDAVAQLPEDDAQPAVPDVAPPQARRSSVVEMAAMAPATQVAPDVSAAGSGAPVQPAVEDAFAKAARMLRDAASTMASISRATPQPMPAVRMETLTTTGGQPIMCAVPSPQSELPTPKVQVHASGLLEFESPKALAAYIPRMVAEAGLSAEWTGKSQPSWEPRLFLMHAAGHPAQVPVMGEVIPVAGQQVAVVFKDAAALKTACAGLSHALEHPAPKVVPLPALPMVDVSMDVQFSTAVAALAALPLVAEMGTLHASWQGEHAPSPQARDVAVSVAGLPERLIVHARLGPPRDGVVTITMEDMKKVPKAVNAWTDAVLKSMAAAASSSARASA